MAKSPIWALFFRSLYTTNAGGQIWTEKASIGCLVGESSDGCEPHIDGPGASNLSSRLGCPRNSPRGSLLYGRFAQTPCEDAADRPGLEWELYRLCRTNQALPRQWNYSWFSHRSVISHRRLPSPPGPVQQVWGDVLRIRAWHSCHCRARMPFA